MERYTYGKLISQTLDKGKPMGMQTGSTPLRYTKKQITICNFHQMEPCSFQALVMELELYGMSDSLIKRPESRHLGIQACTVVRT